MREIIGLTGGLVLTGVGCLLFVLGMSFGATFTTPDEPEPIYQAAPVVMFLTLDGMPAKRSAFLTIAYCNAELQRFDATFGDRFTGLCVEREK